MQLPLPIPERNWGGRRLGAGRPRKHALPELKGKPGIPHRKRPPLARYHPVHVTTRVRNGVGNLREYARTQIIEQAFTQARLRFGMRIVHWSIQGTHLHLIVEVESREALARGMRALGIRLARRLNSLIGRKGPVVVDRYHTHVLRSPREVARAVRYVVRNLFLHMGIKEAKLGDWRFIDPQSSAFYAEAPEQWQPQMEPRTWLLRVGWRRATS